MQSLASLKIRSLRVIIDAAFEESNHDTLTPTFEERGGREMIEVWLRETEMRLQFGSVLASGAPVPTFGIVQDDEAIPIPHWAPPEGLEQTRIHDEKGAKAVEEARPKIQARLEQGHRFLYGQGDGR